jgi:pseudouridine-5'-phosphate glycosidase
MRLSEEHWVDGERRRLEFTVIAATCCLAATVLRRATGIVGSVHRSTTFDIGRDADTLKIPHPLLACQALAVRARRAGTDQCVLSS